MTKFFPKINKLEDGFTLVETLVAISIFTMSILSVLVILSSGIANTNYAKTKITAEYLAQEGIEYVRNIRDTYALYPINGTWNDFVMKISTCNQSNSCGFDVSAPLTDPNYIFSCATHPPYFCKLFVLNGNYNTNSSGVDSGFVRTITASPNTNPYEIKITSDVSWVQGSGTYHATFSENLFDWIQP